VTKDRQNKFYENDFASQVTKDRRRGRLKRVMLATPAASVMNRVGIRDPDFEAGDDPSGPRYRTSSQELQEMVSP
jgi:hypothetical protein